MAFRTFLQGLQSIALAIFQYQYHPVSICPDAVDIELILLVVTLPLAAEHWIT